MSYSTKIDSALAAIATHADARGLAGCDDPTIGLYHLLDSLLELCDARGIDFDAELSCLRDDINADRDSEVSAHPFKYDHSSLIGVARSGSKDRA